MNTYVVTFQVNPTFPVQQSVVQALSYDVNGDAVTFYNKRDSVATIRGFITVTKAQLSEQTVAKDDQGKDA